MLVTATRIGSAERAGRAPAPPPHPPLPDHTGADQHTGEGPAAKIVVTMPAMPAWAKSVPIFGVSTLFAHATGLPSR